MVVERVEVLERISAILDGQCINCSVKKDLAKSSKGNLSRMDRYCKSECTHGIKLQQLGEMLGCRERKQVQWDEPEEADDLAKSLTSLAGD
ncbi:zinc-finger domain-containing protein [Paenibacillus sp. RUD330]|uniref:zinc-finger domain-containing protein n=1 Tax=Paenibacillus sp. RUD330 TaxID=2023772 RepID=UPI0012FE7341|nr:zinc-finger domain-containing protein [Paenibacillus sp. RUD330]ASS64720.2 zinc-finger domain-containing protein [Paenibacillus sp. RUD330]